MKGSVKERIVCERKCTAKEDLHTEALCIVNRSVPPCAI